VTRGLPPGAVELRLAHPPVAPEDDGVPGFAMDDKLSRMRGSTSPWAGLQQHALRVAAERG